MRRRRGDWGRREELEENKRKVIVEDSVFVCSSREMGKEEFRV